MSFVFLWLAGEGGGDWDVQPFVCKITFIQMEHSITDAQKQICILLLSFYLPFPMHAEDSQLLSVPYTRVS